MFVSPHSRIHPRKPQRGRRSGFSLVEVVIAIGVVSFAMVAILGSLPVGIQSMQDAMQMQAKASIAQQLRSDLQQIPYGAASTDGINELETITWYYTSQGMKTEEPSQAFYAATFQVETATLESEGSTSPTEFDLGSARNIRATLEFPLTAPEANRKQTHITLFSAKQKNA